MKPIDLKDLIVGLMHIILLAVAVGQYPRLERFAQQQAAQALKGWPAPPPFFPKGWKPSHPHPSHH